MQLIRAVLRRSSVVVLPFALVLAGAMLVPADAHAGAFSSFKGSWSGGGKVRLGDGKSEKIRCRAYYTPKSGGKRLGMAIRCASAGNKFELRASLDSAGNAVSGSWEERTFNAAGNVSGKASGGKLSLRISGSMNGRVTISTTGRKQFVSISASGTGLKGITISLRKRG